MVGRNRSTVANLLRLLQLPAEVQALVHGKSLSEGHARALLALEDRRAHAVASPRECRRAGLVGARDRGACPGRCAHRVPPARRPRPARPQQTPRRARRERVEDALRKHLGTDVRVTARRRGRGFLTISYYSNDDLARLLELILGSPFEG